MIVLVNQSLIKSDWDYLSKLPGVQISVKENQGHLWIKVDYIGAPPKILPAEIRKSTFDGFKDLTKEKIKHLAPDGYLSELIDRMWEKRNKFLEAVTRGEVKVVP